MLVTLGKRSQASPTAGQLLLDCHARIRKFCAVARNLAAATNDQEAREAATALHRYFAIALPLHVADEEESLAPRLARLRDADIDVAVSLMTKEHVELDATLEELLRRWQEIIGGPTSERCQATNGLASAIEADFARHLLAEETILFPSVAKLGADEARTIVAEMRARRSDESTV